MITIEKTTFLTPGVELTRLQKEEHPLEEQPSNIKSALSVQEKATAIFEARAPIRAKISRDNTIKVVAAIALVLIGMALFPTSLYFLLVGTITVAAPMLILGVVAMCFGGILNINTEQRRFSDKEEKQFWQNMSIHSELSLYTLKGHCIMNLPPCYELRVSAISYENLIFHDLMSDLHVKTLKSFFNQSDSLFINNYNSQNSVIVQNAKAVNQEFEIFRAQFIDEMHRKYC